MNQDVLLDAVVELEDVGRRVEALRSALARLVAEREQRVEKIMEAVREEMTPLPPLCHDYAPPQHVADFCATDEPPSKPL